MDTLKGVTMQKLFAFVLGVAAILWGGFILLVGFAGCAIQNPKLQGADYWLAVLRKMFRDGASACGILTGLGLVCLGLVWLAQATFPTGTDEDGLS